MIIERKDNEILVRFSTNTNPSKIQSILDYLRYEELSFKSKASEADNIDFLDGIKKGRTEKIKKELGFDD